MIYHKPASWLRIAVSSLSIPTRIARYWFIHVKYTWDLPSIMTVKEASTLSVSMPGYAQRALFNSKWAPPSLSPRTAPCQPWIWRTHATHQCWWFSSSWWQTRKTDNWCISILCACGKSLAYNSTKFNPTHTYFVYCKRILCCAGPASKIVNYMSIGIW